MAKETYYTVIGLPDEQLSPLAVLAVYNMNPPPLERGAGGACRPFGGGVGGNLSSSHVGCFQRSPSRTLLRLPPPEPCIYVCMYVCMYVLYVCVQRLKRPGIWAKETYYRGKRDLLQRQKRPAIGGKVTCYRGKRDLLWGKKRPTIGAKETYLSRLAPPVIPKETYYRGKRDLL